MASKSAFTAVRESATFNPTLMKRPWLHASRWLLPWSSASRAMLGAQRKIAILNAQELPMSAQQRRIIGIVAIALLSACTPAPEAQWQDYRQRLSRVLEVDLAAQAATAYAPSASDKGELALGSAAPPPLPAAMTVLAVIAAASRAATSSPPTESRSRSV